MTGENNPAKRLFSGDYIFVSPFERALVLMPPTAAGEQSALGDTKTVLMESSLAQRLSSIKRK
jgi:hypothetical protein